MARLVAGLARLNVDINIYVYAFDAELVIVNLYTVSVMSWYFLNFCITVQYYM